jgi:feruloyl esterase
MKGLGKIINRMARNRRQWEGLMKASSAALPAFEAPAEAPSRLTEVTGFGANPGNLRMFAYAPQNVPRSPALVVVLHGCTQDAAGYDHGAGWSSLADLYGFVLLFPEQQDVNNPKRCFNWFQLGDIQRDHGEAHSIRQMIEHLIRRESVDRDRVFVTGLSAGGAMTATMLATYPEVFAAGAIIAGLPHRAATSVPEAFESMFQGRTRSAREWGDFVREASPHRGPWPRVSVWHGSADATVHPMNAGEIIKQWTNVHGLPAKASRKEVVDGHPRRVWTNAVGEDIMEEYILDGLAHGTPLATGSAENAYGAAGPFLLEAGISSSYHIAKFWGLTENAPRRAREKAPVAPAKEHTQLSAPHTAPAGGKTRDRADAGSGSPRKDRKPSSLVDVGSVIAKALKAAGLMK